MGPKLAMQSGFNTNIRHRGVMFHVQTEDSGRANPHVTTHLYHGGSILASEKCAYADQLDQADLAERVKELMDQQHTALVKRLKKGALDGEIVERLGASVFGESPAEAAPAKKAAASDKKKRKPAAKKAERAAQGAHFGEGLISEKPLDEIVLEYLVESSRARKRRSK